MSTLAEDRVVIRRELHDGDAQGIVDLHERIYVPQYGMNDRFVAGVAESLEVGLAGGWPDASGAVWLIDGEDGLAGSLGLTDEGGGVGRVRWFVFEPELRGRGIGRALVTDLVTEARLAGMRRLELMTFSALRTAGHLYRSAGFRVDSTRETDDWGPTIHIQWYGLDLE